jgi:choline dehydrogenase-like flavoprotein
MCPVDAKFTILNSFMGVYEDPRVEVLLDAEALYVDVAGNAARSVRFRRGKIEASVKGDLVVLGANALFNPIILQRSSLDHSLLGRGLHEQIGVVGEVYLDGPSGFDGSTSVTGHCYHLYDDEERRKEMAGCLIETWNVGRLRTEFGRWRQVLPVRMVFEDLPEERNFVTPGAEPGSEPTVHYAGHSAYAERAIRRAQADLERVMSPLPVERVEVREKTESTEAHILGTTVMGRDPETSVVDAGCIHHRVRNIVVLGSGTFPAGGPANPTLTLSALSLYAANRMLSGQRS